MIDLNCDLGESYGRWRLGDDDAMLRLVTSANVACGFHAGDPSTMLATFRRAAELGVNVGAHVSYQDLAGFGRREMDVPAEELRAEVLYQLAAAVGVARTAGATVTYVKPHGALYNRAARDAVQAAAVASAVAAFDPSLVVLGPPGSRLLAAAEAEGLGVRTEGFPDRGYADDGSLLPRSVPGAVLTDSAEIARRAVAFATGGLAFVPDSLCLHGDTPGAVQHAEAVRAALADAGIEVRAFA